MSKDIPIIKSWVAYLEQTAPVKSEYKNTSSDLKIVRQKDVSADDYLNIYREVGRDYIWNYRPSQTKQEVQSIISSPDTHLFYFYQGDDVIGFSEVDALNPKEVEIVHFGFLPKYINKGFGKIIFQMLLNALWELKPERLILSTCGLDHPKAVKFYEAAGFSVFKKKEDVEFQDYRYTDFYELTDAPQIPLAKSK